MSRRKKSDYFGYLSRRQMLIFIDILEKCLKILNRWNKKKLLECTNPDHKNGNAPNFYCTDCRISFIFSELKWMHRHLKLRADFTQEPEPNSKSKHPWPPCVKCGNPARYSCDACFAWYCSDCAKEQGKVCTVCARTIRHQKDKPTLRSPGGLPTMPYI